MQAVVVVAHTAQPLEGLVAQVVVALEHQVHKHQRPVQMGLAVVVVVADQPVLAINLVQKAVMV
jgi:hypothetical protein